MESSGELRAADSDRQLVADRLAQAFSEGRIREVEYAERLDAVFRASTYRELSVLTADLPSASRADSRRWLARGDRPGPRGRRMPGVLVVLWTLWGVGVSVNTVVYLLVVVTGRPSVYPWPLWVAGPAGAALGTITLASRGRWRERSAGTDPSAPRT